MIFSLVNSFDTITTPSYVSAGLPSQIMTKNLGNNQLDDDSQLQQIHCWNAVFETVSYSMTKQLILFW